MIGIWRPMGSSEYRGQGAKRSARRVITSAMCLAITSVLALAAAGSRILPSYAEPIRGKVELEEISRLTVLTQLNEKNRVKSPHAQPTLHGTTGAGASEETDSGRSAPSRESSLQSDTLPGWMTKLPPWMSKTTPNVGSAQWKREQAETERQERRIREAIEGICRGC